MGRTLALFTYKLRFFFGPSLRGRFGPLSYAALILIFVPSGFLFGLQLGNALRMADPGTAIGLLSTPLAALLSFGLLYSLGAGITAHASEFDFFFTADVRPREYLFADLLFQFISLLAAGGPRARSTSAWPWPTSEGSRRHGPPSPASTSCTASGPPCPRGTARSTSGRGW